MSISIKSSWVEPVLWLLSIGHLLWYVFISVVVMDPTDLIPILLTAGVISLLYLRHEYLVMALQLLALYLLMSAGLKLLAAYMQSIGSITYDWSTASLYRNVFFLLMAVLLYYISWREISTDA